MKEGDPPYTPFNELNQTINSEDLRFVVPGIDNGSARTAYHEALEYLNLPTDYYEVVNNDSSLKAIRELFCPPDFEFLEGKFRAVVEKNPENNGNYEADLRDTLSLMQKRYPNMTIHINDQIFVDWYKVWDTKSYVQQKWFTDGDNKKPGWHRPIMVYGKKK